MTELWRLPLTGLSAALQAGEVTAVSLLEAFTARIRKLDPRLNALVTPNPEAEAQAQASDRRRAKGRPLGPLDGIPLAVKDNILTAGIRTTWGSPSYADYVPDADEIAVSRLKAAGMVILGKTNVPEFTLEGFTDNPLFGPTRNPFDPALTPGGSSGGSVTGVAAGLFPAALGTDGGGSIRRPAGYTGLIGLKPSIGRVPRVECLPQILLDLEVIGPLARTVEDAALVFKAMAGPHPLDPNSWHGQEEDAGASLDQAPGPLKILYVERFGDAPLDPIIAASCRAFTDQLKELGHEVSEGPLPLDISPLTAGWPLIGKSGLAFLDQTIGSDFQKASTKYRNMAAEGRATGSGDFFTLMDAIAGLRRKAAGVFCEVDVILTPSAAAMPWAIGMDYPPEIDGQPVGPRGHAVYTGWVNAIGHPAITLPAQASGTGLPIGIQLVGGFNRDWRLLRLARQIETAFPFPRKWPALAEEG
ncbi:amidase [Roseibium suaedae]|uniref:Aspartyl-tRNA(Asn)/glutamyl-tRNA(Gln) amidotransferase subunit A n=1 Tax=Roseibium suaedae TaxID=735517 RepID=A0A1M7P9U4_9HYPH|nr:amidase [Roseibium suaedae]SHN13526.1 aspartyl-tRNA(Asn)/glutamyl-tRNA(Gln) amidotransferase subunit A [Roseibium suaedae]